MNKTSLKELAIVSGVSVSTVSKALKDSHEISLNTKKRIREIAEKMNYRPNPYAGYLHTRKSKTIAVIIPEINNNFFVQAIKGIDIIAREKNYHILVYITDDDFSKEESILTDLQNGRVDGVIMSIARNTCNYQHIKKIISSNIGIVFFDRVCEEIETVKIITNDYDSGIMATNHLIENGCRNILYLSLSENLSMDKKRKEGFLATVNRNKSSYKILNCLGSDEECYNSIKEYFLQNDRPDSIFASVEKLAIISYHVLNELNINIPVDVKIICFSNLPTASLLNPSLTTVTQPAFEMGKEAALSLFKHLDKKNIALLNQNIQLSSMLNIRESTTSRIFKSSNTIID